jgi:hypothetical protein
MVEEEAPFQIYKSREITNIWSWVPRGPETKNRCAGEDQQKFTRLGSGDIIFIHTKSHKDWFRLLEVGKGIYRHT